MSASNVATRVPPIAGRLSDQDDETGPKTGPKTPSSLKRVAMTGSLWVLIGHIAGEGLRLVNHIACVWLLGPAAIGVMVMVNVVVNGLKMFSDLGTSASIVQHARGDDPAFLDTAWTIQVLRSSVLFIVACFVAWPVALYRDQPLLAWLLPVAALGTLFAGFSSTGPVTMHRHIEMGKLTIFDVSIKVVMVLSTILLAVLLRNVWALALGGVVSGIYTLVVSHTLLSSRRNRFRWEPDAVRQLVRFGRWIFIATALTFICTHGDKLILGGFLTDTELGIYGSAFLLAMGIPGALRALTNRVLFPVYSQLASQPPEEVRRKITRARVWLQLATLPPLCALAIGGDFLVRLVYPESMHGVGWILQLLAFGGVFRIVELTMSPILLAKGDSFRHMLVLVSQAIVLLAAMVVGGLMGGYFGLIVGVAVSHALNYPILAWAVKRYDVWTPRTDMAFMFGSAAVIAVGIICLG